MKKIQIDVAYEDPTEMVTLTGDAYKRGLEVKVISECGPGAGWPVLEFSGDGQEILEFLDSRGFEFSSDDLEEVN